VKYEFAQDIQERLNHIVLTLGYHHVKLNDVVCIRAHGTKSRGTIARCHALNKVMQKALGRKGFYVLEFLSERFDKMSQEDQMKIIVHEMMHIPKTFGGGFVHHNKVTDRSVDQLFQEYKSKKEFQDNLT